MLNIILYATHSIFTSIYEMKTCPKNQPSNLGCYFLRGRDIFRTCHFSWFLPNPYTRMCVSTIGSFPLFVKQIKHHCKLQVGSWFFGFSLIFDLSLLISIVHKGNNFGDPPPPPLPPGPGGRPPHGAPRRAAPPRRGTIAIQAKGGTAGG